MPRFLLRLTDPRDGSHHYCKWSTVVDAPVTLMMTREELYAWCEKERQLDRAESLVAEGVWTESMAQLARRELDERFARLDATGSTSRSRSAKDALSFNRAGPDESRATVEEIIDALAPDRGEEPERDGYAGELYLIRGLPGAGKTTLAKQYAEEFAAAGFDVTCVAADDFRVDEDGNYRFDSKDRAHPRCFGAAQEAMVRGDAAVIVHNTFVARWELSPYVALAELHGYEVVIVHVVGVFPVPPERNTHGVPDHKIAQMMEAWEVPKLRWGRHYSVEMR